MKSIFASFLLSCLAFVSAAQTVVISKEVQIKLAVLAAPEELRDSATVYGTNTSGEYVLLRQGTNEMVCLADDPQQKGFNVSCYHRDLEPFMKRGRDLKMAGKSAKEIFDIREQEVKAESYQ